MKSLRDLVDVNYLAIAVIACIVMEYILVVMLVFKNFPDSIASIQLYLVITIAMFVIYNYAWDVSYPNMFNIYIRSLLFFILPVALFWAFIQGYTMDVLSNWEWLIVSDMVYIVLTTQFVCFAIILVGVKQFTVVKIKTRENEAVDDYEYI